MLAVPVIVVIPLSINVPVPKTLLLMLSVDTDRFVFELSVRLACEFIVNKFAVVLVSIVIK